MKMISDVLKCLVKDERGGVVVVVRNIVNVAGVTRERRVFRYTNTNLEKYFVRRFRRSCGRL